MNIIVFSKNKEVIKHLNDELSQSDYTVQSFTSQALLSIFIGSETIVNLIYHLGQADDEVALNSLQLSFRDKLNTLVLTNTPDSEQGIRLLGYNIRGYANTFLEHDKLITALSVIQQGEIWAGASLIQHMLHNVTQKNQHIAKTSEKNKDNFFAQLTAREQEIAKKIHLGKQNKVIADELSITERTVKAHLSTIYKKLNIKNRLELSLKF
jgi:DNA-binding NarL/FixJ family response regulator